MTTALYRACADSLADAATSDSIGAVVERTVAIAREMVTAGPLGSLVATKALLLDARRDLVDAAREREDATFAALFRAGVPGTPSPFVS